MIAGWCASAEVRPVYDGFDTGALANEIWLDQQINPAQIDFSAQSRCGANAITITTRTGDGGDSCAPEEPCQRAELRLHDNFWPAFGEDVWYGFSFRVTGDIAPAGSHRVVIGQWKGPNDDSPFVAQRFDNGVFHITVQDNHVRRVVASADGDPDRLELFQQELVRLGRESGDALAAIETLEALAKVQSFSVAVRQGAIQAAPEIQTLIGRAARTMPAPNPSRQDRLMSLLAEFDFVEDLAAYAAPADLRIEPGADPKLPDPRERWVDMAYHIKGGRLDNSHGPQHKGAIDIWANGRFIASVRGNLGYRIDQPLPSYRQYFKFGMYRKSMPGNIIFHFDEFRQGASHAEVAVRCN
jgi:hypothetical protein